MWQDGLNDFLARVRSRPRRVPRALTYASLVWEDVDWDRFDIIGVDHYREAWIKDRYSEMLQPPLARGKPVVVTEFGMRIHQGADSEGGALGWLPGLPPVRPLPAVAVAPRISSLAAITASGRPPSSCPPGALPHRGGRP